MRLTIKQKQVINYMTMVARPVAVKELSEFFKDAQRSMYGKRMRALERKGLVKQFYHKGPWSLA